MQGTATCFCVLVGELMEAEALVPLGTIERTDIRKWFVIMVSLIAVVAAAVFVNVGVTVHTFLHSQVVSNLDLCSPSPDTGESLCL